MIKRMLQYQVLFYIVLLVMAVVIAAVALFAVYFKNTNLEYNVWLSGGSPVPAHFEFGAWPALADADFFKKVRDEFVADKKAFIEADLSNMTIRAWENGSALFTVPIITKGKEGSWWETPAGVYEIKSKGKNIFSGFGHVYMPWSMQFQGNFFIHGWPYYPGGEPVSSEYSGGCIRLRTEDAQKLYEWANVGTPVLVFEKDFGTDAFHYQFRTPRVAANAYLAADLRSNYVFLESSSSVPLPIASLAKLVTALVATEYINLDKQITITKEMIIPTSRPRLFAGQNISAYQLLYPLLAESSNEAAEALAQVLGRERFIGLMNSKARALGMEHAVFTDPAGREAENVATAADLFNLAKYLYNNRSFILKISAGKVSVSAYDPPRFPGLQNFNVFAADPNFVGGKVGETAAAGQTILSVFSLPLQGEKRPIVFVALGAADRAAAAEAMLEYVTANY